MGQVSNLNFASLHLGDQLVLFAADKFRMQRVAHFFTRNQTSFKNRRGCSLDWFYGNLFETRKLKVRAR